MPVQLGGTAGGTAVSTLFCTPYGAVGAPGHAVDGAVGPDDCQPAPDTAAAFGAGAVAYDAVGGGGPAAYHAVGGGDCVGAPVVASQCAPAGACGWPGMGDVYTGIGAAPDGHAGGTPHAVGAGAAAYGVPKTGI